MTKYVINGCTTICWKVEIEADNEDEAFNKANMLHNGKYPMGVKVLDTDIAMEIEDD